MEMTQNGYSVVVGIDVSKAKLDIAWGSNGPLETIENSDKQIAQRFVNKIEDPANTLIVMEFTKPWPDIEARRRGADEQRFRPKEW